MFKIHPKIHPILKHFANTQRQQNFKHRFKYKTFYVHSIILDLEEEVRGLKFFDF